MKKLVFVITVLVLLSSTFESISQESIQIDYGNYLFSHTALDKGGYVIPFNAAGNTEIKNKWQIGNINFYTSKGVVGQSHQTMRLNYNGDLFLTNTTPSPTNSSSVPGYLRFTGYGWNAGWGSKPIEGRITFAGNYSNSDGIVNGVDPYLAFSIKGSGGSGSNPGPSVLTERMRITNKGLVGIGTTDPQNRLHVYDNSTSVYAQVERADKGKIILGAVTNLNRIYSRKSVDNSAYPLMFQIGSTDVLTMSDNYNVGIGTTDPNNKLVIKTPNSDNDEILLRLIHRANTPEAGAGIFLGGSTTDNGMGVKIYGYSDPSSNYNSRMAIYTASGSTQWNLGLTQNKDGNVGIGTTDPGDFKLAVYGKIKAQEVKITMDDWPDYVFADDYNLPTLNEVESYINENNHLPDVPSESEVLEEGIELGEMNKILLQKIEELTLYSIEQNKMIEQLMKQNSKLEERVHKLEKE